MKKLELRKTKVITTLVNKNIFINESKTPTEFIANGVPLDWIPAPGSIIGTALCTGGFKLDPNNLTEEIAHGAMLTMEGLQAAIRKGYVYAWTFEKGIDFTKHNLPKTLGKSTKAKDLAKKGCGQIVTVLNIKSTSRMLVVKGV